MNKELVHAKFKNRKMAHKENRMQKERTGQCVMKLVKNMKKCALLGNACKKCNLS